MNVMGKNATGDGMEMGMRMGMRIGMGIAAPRGASIKFGACGVPRLKRGWKSVLALLGIHHELYYRLVEEPYLTSLTIQITGALSGSMNPQLAWNEPTVPSQHSIHTPELLFSGSGNISDRFWMRLPWM